MPDVLTDQTSAHDALEGLRAARARLRRGHARCARDDPQATSSARMASMAAHVRAMLALQAARRGHLRLRQQPARPGAGGGRDATPSTSAASCRCSSGRCSARARGRSAGPCSRAIRRTSRRPTRRSSPTFPEDAALAPLDPPGPRARRLPGAAGAHLLARLRRARQGAGGCSTSWWRRAKVKAPIVIGRDHLDCGSVASPNRETEGMRDGSDAIGDWPILNALLNAVNGATWVSVHHGGGVGIGYSLHAGMVIVADGTDEAARRLERVLTGDPGWWEAIRREKLCLYVTHSLEHILRLT